MEYSIIAENLKVSRIALGTWAIGGWMWGGSDEKEAIDTILKAIDLGINIIDTAPVYGFGKSEEIVGKALKMSGKRQDIIIATKVGLEWNNSSVSRNSSGDRIIREIEDSLKRLQTDYIDIYQVHWPDEKVPIEETASTMQKLYEEGYIRAIGVSNYTVEQMEKFKKYAKLDTCQPPYNLFERQAEKEILPYCKKLNIKTLLYGSLCRGLLSGKMTLQTQFNGDDLRKIDPKFQQPLYAQYLNAVGQLDDFAKNHYNKRVIHLALRWILDQKGAIFSLVGARRPHQLDFINDIFDFNVSAQDCHEIDLIINRSITNPVGPEFMAPPR